MAKFADQDFVEFVVKSLVNVPDDVSTTRTLMKWEFYLL